METGIKMTLYLSRKIQIFSFGGIVCVLLIHSFVPQGNHLNGFADFQRLIDFLSRIFAPLFFAISGYLFFNNFKFSLWNIYEKVKRRIHTLLIPYILGNMVFFLVLAILKKLPVIKKYITTDIVSALDQTLLGGFYDFLLAPIAFHLWFLRDLIALTLLSPLIYYFCDKKKAWLFLPLFFWGGAYHRFSLSIFLFSFGAFWAINNIPVECQLGRGKSICFFLIVLALEIVFWQWGYIQYFGR